MYNLQDRVEETEYSREDDVIEDTIDVDCFYRPPVRKGIACKLAKKLIQDCGITVAPVNIEHIIRVICKKTPVYLNPTKEFGDRIQGFLHKSYDIYDEEDGYIITYNSKMHPNRTRFTIAHELGHLCFGHLYDFSQDEKNKEVEANAFAKELLMPLDLLKRDLRITRNISKLASLYDVSEESMAWRIQDPKILKLL
jgi:Zn-dependent peptidase ImmA (M78 family)